MPHLDRKQVFSIPRLSLKRRPDGRYACRYKNQWFYGITQAEVLTKRDAFKRSIENGLVVGGAAGKPQRDAQHERSISDELEGPFIN